MRLFSSYSSTEQTFFLKKKCSFKLENETYFIFIDVKIKMLSIIFKLHCLILGKHFPHFINYSYLFFIRASGIGANKRTLILFEKPIIIKKIPFLCVCACVFYFFFFLNLSNRDATKE